MGLVEELTAIVAPVVAATGAELIDVEHSGGSLRVVVDEPGGIGLDRLSEVTQAVSRALDERDPFPGRYTLEVSSPGVERALRTPRHFQRAVGQKATLRVVGDDGSRRVTGIIVAADDETVTVEPTDDSAPDAAPQRLSYRHVDRARTVFEWGPAPKPGKGSKPGAGKRARKAERGGGPTQATSDVEHAAHAARRRGEGA